MVVTDKLTRRDRRMCWTTEKGLTSNARSI